MLRLGLVILLSFINGFCFFGVIRLHFEINLSSAFLLSVILHVLFFFLFFYSKLKPLKSDLSRFRLGALFVLLGLGLALWSLRLLFNPFHDGFPSIGGVDTANHVDLQRLTMAGVKGTYEGFVNFFYSAQLLMDSFGWNYFSAYRLLFYLTLVFVVGVLSFLSFVVFNNTQDLEQGTTATNKRIKDPFVLRSFFALTGVLIFMLTAEVLPLIHNLQIGGFLSHYFGLIPCFTLWFLLTTARGPWHRFMALSYGIVTMRFTYGLNLPDILFVACFYMYREVLSLPLRSPAPQKLFFVGATSSFFLAALYAHYKLYPILGFDGGFRGFQRHLGTALLFAGSVFIFLSLKYLKTRRNLETNSGVCENLLIFPASWAMISFLTLIAWQLTGLNWNYYLYKYTVYPTIALGVGASFALSAVIPELFTNYFAVKPASILNSFYLRFGKLRQPTQALLLLIFLIAILKALSHSVSHGLLLSVIWLVFFRVAYSFLKTSQLHQKLLRQVCVVGCLYVLLILCVRNSYWNTFSDRIRWDPPFKKISPHYDLQAEEFITSFLKTRPDMTFGAYFGRFRGVETLLNTTFGLKDWYDLVDQNKLSSLKSGQCYFWSHLEIDYSVYRQNPMRTEVISRLDSQPERTCHSYPQNPTAFSRYPHPEEICVACVK